MNSFPTLQRLLDNLKNANASESSMKSLMRSIISQGKENDATRKSVYLHIITFCSYLANFYSMFSHDSEILSDFGTCCEHSAR